MHVFNHAVSAARLLASAVAANTLVITMWITTAAAQASDEEIADPLPPSGSASLSLTGGYREQPLGRETLITLALSLPLGEFGRTSAAASGPRLAAKPRPAGAKSQAEDVKAADVPPSSAPASAPMEPEAEPELPPELRLGPELVQRLVHHAVRADGIRARRRRLESLASRSKSSAWLPELSLRGGKRTDQSLRLTPTSTDPYRYSQSDGTDLFAEAKLSWRLDRLLFSKDEPGLVRLGQSEQARHDQVVERLLSALFDWQLAELSRRDPALPPEEQLRFRLLSLQARLRLDVLTRGWFGRLVPTPKPPKK